MSRIGHNFPPPDGLDIPDDIQPGPGWTEQMLEMADHIGAKATLQLIERFGGQKLYIPKDPHNGKIAASIAAAIGAHATEQLCRIYGREYIEVPAARYVLARARRHNLVAAVRAGDINVSEAARILKTKRTYMSFLVNHTDEGFSDERAARRAVQRLPGQMNLFGDEEADLS